MMRQKRLIAVLLLLVFSGTALVGQQRSSSPIRQSTLKGHIRFLADDMLEGRGTGARGGDLAAKYIASELEASGLKGGAADGSFFQPVSLVGVKADPGSMLMVSNGRATEVFTFGDD